MFQKYQQTRHDETTALANHATVIAFVNVSSEASSSCEPRQQARKPKTECGKEEIEYLHRLWAENYKSINSVHSKKVWNEIVVKLRNKSDSKGEWILWEERLTTTSKVTTR